MLTTQAYESMPANNPRAAENLMPPVKPGEVRNPTGKNQYYANAILR